jgi:hypothetical protein
MPTTSTSTVGMLKGDPVTHEELTPEHNQKFDEIKAIFEADLIGSFERTRHHGIWWKGFSPEGALDGVDLSLPSEQCTSALRQEVNYMVAHSLHRHSESLVNAFERVMLRIIQEIMKNQYSPTGPTLVSHKGELSFQIRPPLPYALAALESHGALAYVVYKVGGDHGDYQFFNELPKEVPHGYAYTYILDSSNLVRSIQQAAEGISGIGYTKPYPSDYDMIPLPPKYRLPEFTKFNGLEGSSSIEHISRYLVQLGMISVSDPLQVRFFL